ncbi:hypothetical protein FB451DRAFT_1420670 [Mycena latifolia]|nr:hypothetical protein FB451DRAFT_1420670 [Mycena latifolia]
MVEKPNARALSLGPAAREHEDGVKALTLPQEIMWHASTRLPKIYISVTSTKLDTDISPSISTSPWPRKLHTTYMAPPTTDTKCNAGQWAVAGEYMRTKEKKERETDRSPAGRLRGPILRRDSPNLERAPPAVCLEAGSPCGLESPSEGSPNGLQSCLETGSPSGLRSCLESGSPSGLDLERDPPEVLSCPAKDPPTVLMSCLESGSPSGLDLERDPPEVLSRLAKDPSTVLIILVLKA